MSTTRRRAGRAWPILVNHFLPTVVPRSASDIDDCGQRTNNSPKMRESHLAALLKTTALKTTALFTVTAMAMSCGCVPLLGRDSAQAAIATSGQADSRFSCATLPCRIILFILCSFRNRRRLIRNPIFGALEQSQRDRIRCQRQPSCTPPEDILSVVSKAGNQKR